MWFTLIYNSLIVFAITLLITKSKIFGCKRQYVDKRYKASQINQDDNNRFMSMIHSIWHAWWTCPMCCGMWTSAAVCVLSPVYYVPTDILVIFSFNWGLHCAEDFLVEAVKYFTSDEQFT